VLANEDGLPLARVTATAVEPGWGVAFRVQDAENFWALAVDPTTEAWAVVVYEDGRPAPVAAAFPTLPADGTRVQVATVGDRILLAVGGEPVPLEDPRLADATGFGLVALVPENLASMAWDDLELARS
jgi:hypothetical protein